MRGGAQLKNHNPTLYNYRVIFHNICLSGPYLGKRLK